MCDVVPPPLRRDLEVSKLKVVRETYIDTFSCVHDRHTMPREILEALVYRWYITIPIRIFFSRHFLASQHLLPATARLEPVMHLILIGRLVDQLKTIRLLQNQQTILSTGELLRLDIRYYKPSEHTQATAQRYPATH